MNTTENESSYVKAREQVKHLRKFYMGLINYILVIGLLAAINYYVDRWNNPWFLWAALGWGIGLFFQASRAYKWHLFMNNAWEERKIKEFMEKEERAKGNLGRWE